MEDVLFAQYFCKVLLDLNLLLEHLLYFGYFEGEGTFSSTEARIPLRSRKSLVPPLSLESRGAWDTRVARAPIKGRSSRESSATYSGKMDLMKILP